MRYCDSVEADLLADDLSRCSNPGVLDRTTTPRTPGGFDASSNRIRHSQDHTSRAVPAEQAGKFGSAPAHSAGSSYDARESSCGLNTLTSAPALFTTSFAMLLPMSADNPWRSCVYIAMRSTSFARARSAMAPETESDTTVAQSQFSASPPKTVTYASKVCLSPSPIGLFLLGGREELSTHLPCLAWRNYAQQDYATVGLQVISHYGKHSFGFVRSI